MIGQSFAIIAVILVMIFMFIRAGRRSGALLALPLISVPVFHLLGYVAHKIFEESTFPTSSLHIAIDFAGLVVGIILCWELSRKIPAKLVRYVYFICCAVFLAALTGFYVFYHS